MRGLWPDAVRGVSQDMAVELGLMSETDANAILEQHGAAGFLKRCEESELVLCPECFEDEVDQG